MKAAIEAVVGAVLCVGLFGALVVIYHLVRQQGHIMLRLDALERRLVAAQAPPTAAAGVAVGETVSDLELPDFGGAVHTLDDIDASRVLLVNWSPASALCEAIAPKLAELEPSLRREDTAVVLVADGDVETNRSLVETNNLGCEVLLQDGSFPVPAFQGVPTPAAYLLDERKRVIRPLAVGPESVLDLAGSLPDAITRGEEVAGERTLIPA